MGFFPDLASLNPEEVHKLAQPGRGPQIGACVREGAHGTRCWAHQACALGDARQASLGFLDPVWGTPEDEQSFGVRLANSGGLRSTQYTLERAVTRKGVSLPGSAEEPQVGASFARVVLAGSRAQLGA